MRGLYERYGQYEKRPPKEKCFLRWDLGTLGNLIGVELEELTGRYRSRRSIWGLVGKKGAIGVWYEPDHLRVIMGTLVVFRPMLEKAVEVFHHNRNGILSGGSNHGTRWNWRISPG